MAAKARARRSALDLARAEVPEGDYDVPLGTVAVRRDGPDVTILANMLMLHRALAAAEQLAEEGIEAEVIDVRCLVPLDIGHDRAIGREDRPAADRRGRQSHRRLGRGNRGPHAESHYLLKGPIRRVAAPDTPLPCAASLERAYVPSVERIVAAVRELVG